MKMLELIDAFQFFILLLYTQHWKRTTCNYIARRVFFLSCKIQPRKVLCHLRSKTYTKSEACSICKHTYIYIYIILRYNAGQVN